MRSTRDEARRWTKFPATVMFATGFLWLVESLLTLDWQSRGQQVETAAGSILALLDLVVIPLGAIAIGFGMLFLLRWALWLGMIFPLMPLLLFTAEKLPRITGKFAEFRGGAVSGLEGGVMTVFLVVALWVVYILIIDYLRRAMRLLNKAEGWLRQPVANANGGAAMASTWPTPGPHAAMLGDDSEVCLLMPDLSASDGLDENS